ncbi:disease resistance protein RPM1 [Setaria viridis]|uniref:disease resistance protein RPM1 n=1 Tax=Setaria viridis TaxID=4556 RepID=UPI003B3B5ABE
MAEIAILLVMKKITIALAEETLRSARPLLAKKSQSITELPCDMKLIKNELELIRAFLNEIDRKGEVTETWIGQVRRLAFDMEDIVDQFFYVVGNNNQKRSWWDHVKKIVKKPQSLFSLDEIAIETKRINQELKQLSESRDRWAKPLDCGTTTPVTSYETEPYLPGHDYSINDDDLVGTDKNKQTLIGALHFEDHLLRIIAVWGMGGIGKSTLVNDVYKNELSSFDCHAWVSISHKYKLEDIWRNMLSDLLRKDKKEFDAESMNSTYLIDELKQIMSNKRYLVILDDVWTTEVILKLRNILVDNGLGSRVIITTRMEEVASMAEDGCKIKLEPLNDHDAWVLFCRKAFPKIQNHICPPDLHQCEDYLIRRRNLTWTWIAEGFIEPNGASSLEDVADGYVDQLVNRSMLQVASRNSFARIKCLRMHDLVRELAIFQSTKESFSTNYDENHGMMVDFDSRRLSVLQCNKGIPLNIYSSRLRAFITFDTSMALSSWYSSILSKSKYLVVLDLSDSPIETVPDSVGELFNLRFLCLNNTNVKELPEFITKLQNLQTLSLECTQLLKFPQGMSKLKKLHHLLFFKLIDATYKSFNNWESMEPFEGLWTLKELQSLNEIRATNVFVANLGNLSQLRVLSISDVKNSHCAQLCDALSKMRHLSRLEIRTWNENELLHLDNLELPNPLQVLDLYGRFSEGTFESPFFLNHGSELYLISLKYCQLTENQLSQLSRLSKLTYLDLTRAYTGQQLHFNADSFQNLKKILLKDLPHVNQICIYDGALVNLEYLYMDNLPELQDAPIGVDFLASLKEAYCINMHGQHGAFASNFWKAKLDHIPNVYSTTEGK